MAIWIVKNSGKTSYGIKRYLCDTEEDLPYNENGEAVAPGSKAYVIADKATFMMGSNGEWYQIQEGSGSGGASSMSELTDVDLTGLDDGKILKYNEATQTWITSDASASIVELTQEEYDELPSTAKDLSLIYQISDKGYFFYKGKQFRASKEITQEEYDQLSPEEQNNGTEYLITDATTSISDFDDVSISGATDGQGLYYDATLGVWKNSAGKIVYAEIDGTLTAGQDTIVLSSNYITTDSVVDPFVSSAFDGVTYTSMTIANGSVTLVFPVQASDMPVMVRVWIDGYGAANNNVIANYVKTIVVDDNDDRNLSIIDGNDDIINTINGTVTTTPAGTISASLPSATYDASTYTLAFDPGTLPTFTGTASTNDINFSEV